jgi:hypothetical protein
MLDEVKFFCTDVQVFEQCSGLRLVVRTWRGSTCRGQARPRNPNAMPSDLLTHWDISRRKSDHVSQFSTKERNQSNCSLVSRDGMQPRSVHT